MLITYTFRRALLDKTSSSGEVRSRKLANRTDMLSVSVFRLVCKNDFSTQSVPIFHELSCKVCLVTFAIMSLL